MTLSQIPVPLPIYHVRLDRLDSDYKRVIFGEWQTVRAVNENDAVEEALLVSPSFRDVPARELVTIVTCGEG
jgi:hypothetical protein